MKKILTYITLILLTSTAVAQNYPVQSNVNITPPYSVYLSDYASMTSNKLLVTLMLKDVNQSDIQVKLRLTIKGNGIEIRTKADYLPQPLLLQGGAPLLISGTDLESYLNPANLDFSGISKSEFTKTGKLPEGVYQFIVEAIEYRRNVAVSNAGMTIGWLVLNDPPRWTLPMANSLLTATYPQNIFFSWMPMSTASPNAAFTTEYEFTIVELWPDNRSPGDAINSSIPLYQVTTSNTSLVYGPAEPELTPGRKYVCRLRAYDTEGRDLFKNKGYSELLVFTFGQSCKPPNTIQHQVLGPEDARVNWNSLPGNTQFVLSYAEQNTDGTWSNWYHNETLMPTSNIKGLKAEHTYRYQLKAICGTLESEYSDIKQFNTPTPDTTVVECGKDISIPKVDDSPLLPMLKVGDIINVGGFEARVVEVEGSNGTFSGKCVVNVKTFGGVRILSEFENISVNESHQVTAGAINSVKGELNIIGLDEIIKEVVDVFDNTENDPNVGDPYEPGDPVTIVINGQTVTVSGDTTFTTPDGTEVIVTLSGQPPIVTVDGEPTEVTTDKLDFDNPNTVTGNELASNVTDTSAYAIKLVTFKPVKNQLFGFDQYPEDIPQFWADYKKEKVNKKDYPVNWKSNQSFGLPDKVIMDITTDNPDSIKTRLSIESSVVGPLSYSFNPEDSTWVIQLNGQSHENEDRITAFYTQDDGSKIAVGHLDMVSYNKQDVKLVIVPVGDKYGFDKNPNYTELKDSLNAIYKGAITFWDVSITDPLEVDYEENDTIGLDTELPDMAAYTKEMRNLRSALKDRSDYNKDAYYLFLIDTSEKGDKNGIMPFRRHFGFIFMNDGNRTLSGAEVFHTIAHELGHGAFGLEHIWQEKGTSQGATYNLMDYTSKKPDNLLRKYQWYYIHNPKSSWFGGSEEETSDLFIAETNIDEGKGLAPDGRVVLGFSWKNDKNVKEYVIPYLSQEKLYVIAGFTVFEQVGSSRSGKTDIKGESIPFNMINSDKFKDKLFVNVVTSADEVKVYLPIDKCKFKAKTIIQWQYKSGMDVVKTVEAKLDENKAWAGKNFYQKDESECYDKVNTEPSWLIPELFTENLNEKASEEAFNNEVDKSAEILDKHLKNTASLTSDYGETQYKYIINKEYVDKVLYSDITKKNLLVLEHKLKFLSEQSKNKGKQIQFYVLFTPSDVLFSNSDFNRFAKAVYEKSILNQNSNAILITVPIALARTNIANDQKRRYHMPGYHLGNKDLVDAFLLAKSKYKTDKLIYFISEIYRCIYKPSIRHIGYLQMNGTPIYQYDETLDEDGTAKFVSGRSACIEIILLKKPEYDDYISCKPDRSGYNPPTLYPSTGSYYSTDFDLFKYSIKKQTLLEESEKSEWVSFTVENSVNLKEKYITDELAIDYVLIYAFKSGFKRWLIELGSVTNISENYELETVTFDESQTYNLSFWKTIDPIIYGTLDVASIGLSFVGMDFIADGIGLIYAVSRGDVGNIAAYSIAVLIPIANGSAIEVVKVGIKKSSKFMKVIAHSADNVVSKTIESVGRTKAKYFLKIPEEKFVPDGLLDNFIKNVNDGKIAQSQFTKVVDETNIENKIKYIDEAVQAGKNLDEVSEQLIKNGFDPQYADEIAEVVEEGCDIACTIGKYGCFAGNTNVETQIGLQKISSITEGNVVYSYNNQTHKKELKLVTSLKNYLVKSLIVLGLSTGEQIQATSNHPFFVNGKYIELNALEVGDTLFTNNINVITVQSLDSKDTSAIVYNITISENNNYFVGNSRILVHNACLASSLKKFTNLTKEVDKLPSVAKKRFMEFFRDASDEVLEVLEKSPELKKLLSHLTSNSNEGIKGLSVIMKNSKADAELVVNSWKKAEDLGCTLKKKAFPGNNKRPEVFNAAKEYQGKISGHPDLSFEKNGISFDAIKDGKLIDAKLGYGKSTFIDILDEELEKWVPEVFNDKLKNSLLSSAKRQLDAVSGTGMKIEWYVSNDIAQRGISQLFADLEYDIIVKLVKP